MAPSIPNTKFFGLDHLRTLAITLVFVYHFGRLFPHPEWTNTISKFGWTGVDLFFVLSGYLISSQLFSKIAQEGNFSLKEFFLKRFFRIIPPYIIVVSIYFIFPDVHEREGLAPLWKYLSFTQNLGLNLLKQGTFSHAWSLCVEEQFYLLLPLILSVLVYLNVLKKGHWLIIILFLMGFMIRLYSYQTYVIPNIVNEHVWAFWYQWIYYPTYCRLDGLLIGISIAALFQYKPNFKHKMSAYGNLFLFISVLILIGAYYLCLDERSFAASVFGFPLVSVGYGVMVLGAITQSSFLYKIKSRITIHIATLSYSIYLIHKFIIHIVQDQFSKFNIAKDSNLMFLLCILTTITGAIIMNQLIEKPFLKLKDRLIEQLKI